MRPLGRPRSSESTRAVAVDGFLEHAVLYPIGQATCESVRAIEQDGSWTERQRIRTPPGFL